MIDLHVHSTYSDGTLTPSELVAMAKNRNIQAFALTDHDTTEGIEEAITAGQKQNITLIPGIEFSVYYIDREIHIVGLFIEYQNENLQNKLQALYRGRIERNLKIVEKLNALGISLTIEDIQVNVSRDLITRSHFATALMQKQFVKTRKEAFEKYLDYGKPAFVDREYFAPQECMELIQSCGGVSILAHPTLYHMTDKQIDRMAADFKSMGLDGIEGIYSTFTHSETILIQKLAKKNNLLISGGSDFHGDNKPDLHMGTGYGKLRVPDEILLPIQSLAGKRKNQNKT